MLGFVSLAGLVHAEVMASLPWDGLIVDMQHGAMGYDEAVGAIGAIARRGIVPLVRVPGGDAATIGRYLDAGAAAIVCPQIDGRDQAATFVRACRYPPDGIRSYGPLRANLLYGQETPKQANRAVLTIAIVESAAAMEEIDAIVSTPGLDGVLVGVADLAISEGRTFTGYDDERTRASVERVIETAARRGVRAGIPVVGDDSVPFVLASRPDWIVVGTDIGFLVGAGQAALNTVRSAARR